MKGLFLKQPEMDQMRLILRHRQTLLFSAFLSASLCPSMAQEVTLQMIKDEVEGIKRDINAGWLVICGAMVFCMQTGFVMLEAGVVQPKNSTGILLKNIAHLCLSVICFWVLGHGFAYGKDRAGLIGASNFALADSYPNSGGSGSDGYEIWFFQWAFASIAATIFTSAVAERIKWQAHSAYTALLTAFIYPVVVHWAWGTGWLSAWGALSEQDGIARPLFQRNSQSNGVIDWAGSGIVHMVGGFSGLMGAIILGPRTRRFDSDDHQPSHDVPANNALLTLGTLVLWFGWYGLTCGRTLVLVGGSASAINPGGGKLAGKVAMTTTIAAAAGGLAVFALCFLTARVPEHVRLTSMLKGVLSGLVGISASCAIVDPWHALVIGAISGAVYFTGQRGLVLMRIDDALHVSVVHGLCGAWGLVAAGVFCTDENVQYAAYPNINRSCARGEQFGVQIVAVLVIISWTVVCAGLALLLLQATMGLRIEEAEEELETETSAKERSTRQVTPMKSMKLHKQQLTQQHEPHEQQEEREVSKRQHQTETKMQTTNAQDEVRKQDTGTQQEPLQQQPVSQSVSRSRHNRNSRNEASPATPAASVRSQIPRGGETAEGPLDTTQSLRSNRNTQSTLSSKTRGHNDGDYGDVGGVWSVVRHPEVSTVTP